MAKTTFAVFCCRPVLRDVVPTGQPGGHTSQGHQWRRGDRGAGQNSPIRHRGSQASLHSFYQWIVVSWNFGTNPDSRICTTNLWIWIRIRILLFSPVTFRMPTENIFFSNFFGFYFLKVYLHNFLKMKSHNFRSNKTEVSVFLTIFTVRSVIEGQRQD